MTVEYEKIKEKFLSGNPEGCEAFFEKNNFLIEAGYCCIISDNLNKARELFLRASEYDRRAAWGLLLLQMIEGKITIYPTYFEIRNFLEIDLNLLILYCKADYIEKIICYADFMTLYNPECYKFIGRAFWANNFIPAAMFFLRKAKDKMYNDPELHYLLAYIYYYNDNDIENCYKALKACLGILPEYAPAKALLQITSINNSPN